MRAHWRRKFAFTALAMATIAGLTLPRIAAADDVPRMGEITAHLVDAEGKPVVKALVEIFHGDTYISGGVTDAQGIYHYDALATGDYTVMFDTWDPYATTTAESQRIWYRHSLSGDTATPVSVTQNQVTTVEESLFPTGSLDIFAIDAVTHLPQKVFCAGAGPQTGPGSGASGCTTTGVVRLTGLLPGAYNITANGDGLHGSGTSTATVRVGHTALALAKLPQEAGITTTVRDSATNQPVTDVCLSAVATTNRGNTLDRRNGTHVAGTPGNCSDENGKILIGHLPSAADYQLFTVGWPTGYGAQWVGPKGGTGLRSAAAVVRTRVGRSVPAPDVHIDRAGTITGTVTDATTGNPAQGVCAFPYARDFPGFDPRLPNCSDANGHYTISELGPYKWPVEFISRYATYAWQWSGGAPDSASAVLNPVTADATTTVDAVMSVGYSVTGHVTMAAGTTASVSAYSAVTGERAARGIAVAADGSYTMAGVTAQTVKIAVTPGGNGPQPSYWYGGTSFATATPVTVASAVSGIDVTLP